MEVDDTAARLSEIDMLVTRANEIAQSVRRDLLARRVDDSVEESASGDIQARRRLERRLEERSREIATLTALVRDLEADFRESSEQLKWFSKVLIATLSRPMQWSMLPASRRIRKKRLRLADAGLFDGDAYLRRYPDVAGTGMDPLLHYVEHGLAEGRQR